MKIPGINSILNEHASAIWKAELEAGLTPDQELVNMFEAAREAIENDQFWLAGSLLERISDHDLLPSQDLRLWYLQSMSCSDQRDYRQAYNYYAKALDIAVEHGDFDSRFLLTVLAGKVLYGALRNREAIIYYQLALELWRDNTRTIHHPPIEPEVMLLEAMGTSQWNIGAFEEAHGTLARIVALEQNRRTAFREQYLGELLAKALWTLALVHRSQSDKLDGDENLIRTALRRAKKAVWLFRDFGSFTEDIGRLHVQIAELYLDLAELHFLRGMNNAARPMYHEGDNFAHSAAKILEPTDDNTAKLLAKLTLLRHDLMGQTPRELSLTWQETDSRMLDIERAAAVLNDKFISAKAGTLRGEWLIALGDKEKARAALLLALEGFQNDGIGMATRALRLLRRINNQPPNGASGVRPRPKSGPRTGPKRDKQP